MSKLINHSYWINKNGLTIKYTIPWYLPFKNRKQKTFLLLMDLTELVYTYDAELGTTGDVVNRVWSVEKGVEL